VALGSSGLNKELGHSDGQVPLMVWLAWWLGSARSAQLPEDLAGRLAGGPCPKEVARAHGPTRPLLGAGCRAWCGGWPSVEGLLMVPRAVSRMHPMGSAGSLLAGFGLETQLEWVGGIGLGWHKGSGVALRLCGRSDGPAACLVGRHR